MDLQWFVALCGVCIAFGFLVGYLLKGKTTAAAMKQLNGFMNILRGEENSPIDNLRFLIAHLQEGGPEQWASLFKNEALAQLSQVDVDKLRDILDSIVFEEVKDEITDDLGNLK